MMQIDSESQISNLLYDLTQQKNTDRKVNDSQKLFRNTSHMQISNIHEEIPNFFIGIQQNVEINVKRSKGFAQLYSNFFKKKCKKFLRYAQKSDILSSISQSFSEYFKPLLSKKGSLKWILNAMDMNSNASREKTQAITNFREFLLEFQNLEKQEIKKYLLGLKKKSEVKKMAIRKYIEYGLFKIKKGNLKNSTKSQISLMFKNDSSFQDYMKNLR